MFNLVFYEPEIPPNTGNAIRLCSNTDCVLHLIEPLGFTLDDKRLRRAGLDYGEYSEVRTYRNWQHFIESCAPGRMFAISTKGDRLYTEASFQPADYLVFGPETRGLPDEIRMAPEMTSVLRIPMLPHSRSLNLSNSAAIIIYEAWRQNGFKGA
ncbi:MAG: tRNA (uridine(34)/cytosine(34)/5-carboxymethylaminomethyluridine(34)-2'-O)-methyltransferase TrmL [Gammaproteobacteria bacterium]|jgi:tRNA (cytidine/uridine-2'-O-)-methyltransferase|nr:tRNA (uridine(34)/cytosine(34)/5-carboxymethylaminomethyluridine(34)-2'-O)-methyltransferase TrmL [Gammaproteobacteria bacterium]MBT6044408.1 tRNA (uridine(34)/cytosine(34)/5-carboxymethylaminomethyluridine(34)-2'-O)-methyltransferase TrmL [Gammaproteobacteria bacterium]